MTLTSGERGGSLKAPFESTMPTWIPWIEQVSQYLRSISSHLGPMPKALYGSIMLKYA